MDTDTKTTAAMLAALRLADERGGASAALAQADVRLPSGDDCAAAAHGFDQLLGEASPDERLTEALALGFLAGQFTSGRRHRALNDVTSFVMDRDLVVLDADGESILRLPWFEEEMFVGRQLPDVHEIPASIRSLAVESYRSALDGERNTYAFTVEAVLAIAAPSGAAPSAVAAAERRAQELDAIAVRAMEQVSQSGNAGRRRLATAYRTRRAADRALHEAKLLGSTARSGDGPALSARELEVLTLASHGFSYSDIARELVVSVATVKTHLAHVYEKLQVTDKAAAVARALRQGLID